MTIFLIRYKNFFEDPRVEKYATPALAEAEVLKPSEKAGEAALVVDTSSNLSDLPGSTMIHLYNLFREDNDKEVLKFENRSIARTRLFARLEARFQHLPVIEAPAIVQKEGDSDMAAVAAKKNPRAAKPAGEGRVVGKPAGLVSEFRPLRDGTDRAKVLKLMSVDGGKTVAAIAKAIDADEKKVLTIAYCINRDCAIGYK